MDGPKPKVKSFEIPKRLVYEAWEKVRDNAGAPGVDAVNIDGSRAAEGQPLQALEPHEFGELLPRAGAGGGDTEGSRGRDQGARRAERGRPNRPDRSRQAAGGEAGADLPP